MAQSIRLTQESYQAGQLMAEKKYARAAGIYRKLVQALPNNPGLALDLGLALYMSGHEQQAIPEFHIVLKLDPHNTPALLYLGYSYLSLGQAKQAVTPLEEVVRANPRNLDARESLADTLLSLGRLGQATELYRSLTKAQPGSAAAWYGLGRSYAFLSQQSYDALGKLAYGSAYWLALVAESNAKAGKYSSAYYLYRQALAQKPDFPGIHAALAQIYLKTSHPAWAKTEEKREHRLGAADCARGKLECAFLAGHYQQAAAVKTDTPESLYWKSKAYNQLALQAFSRLTALPPSPQLHELLAELHDKARDYPVAAGQWKKAYQLSHEDPGIGRHWAIDLIRIYDNRDAEQLLDTLRGQQPHSAEVNYLLGYALLNLQQPAKAIPYFQRALKSDPGLLKAQGELGRAYLQTGQTARAIPYLKVALPLDEDGSLHYQLARAYTVSGQKELAAQMLQAYQKIHLAKEQAAQALKKQVRVTPPAADR